MLFTQDELASYLPDAASDPDRAELLSELAMAVVYSEVPEETADSSLVAKGVALEVTARAFRNVEGFTMESVDDYTYRRPAQAQTAGVYLTPEERAALQKLNPAPRARARSVKLRAGGL